MGFIKTNQITRKKFDFDLRKNQDDIFFLILRY
jgi:hypothetical protein